MNNIFRLLFVIFFTFQSCTTWKSNLTSLGKNDSAIENAILDFFNTSCLAKQDNTFCVYVKELNTDIVGVSIMGTINKLIVTEDGKSSEMPTRYIEYGGKLFYWYDKNYPLKDSIISKLNQYNLIDSIPSFAFAELINDDAKKGVNYFFCKNNLKKYKKMKTAGVLDRCNLSKLTCK